MLSGPYIQTKRLMIVHSLLIIFFSCLLLASAHPVQEQSQYSVITPANVYPRGLSASKVDDTLDRGEQEKVLEGIQKLERLQIHSAISKSESWWSYITLCYTIGYTHRSVPVFELLFKTLWRDPVTKENTVAIAKIHTYPFYVKHEIEGFKMAGLLLDFGRDASNPTYQWTIFRMAAYPAMLIHDLLKLRTRDRSNCLSVVEEAKQVLTSQLKIYVTEKGILPVHPGVREVLFTIDRNTWHPTRATIISWKEWKHIRLRTWNVRDKDIAQALRHMEYQFGSLCPEA